MYEEGVQEALVTTIKAARGLCVLQEAIVGVLGWCEHKHARVEAVWPADVTHCCQLFVAEEVVGVLYTLQ